MPKYAAFLRGMNVGGHRITNTDLCAQFEAMGYQDVAAFLASGNVVFSATARRPTLERQIEEGLARALDYAVPTFLRTAAEVRHVANFEPFPAADIERSNGKLQVIFLSTRPKAADRKAVLSHATDEDRLALDGRELFWLPHGPMSKSTLDLGAIEKRLGSMTIRTARTVTRLATKYF